MACYDPTVGAREENWAQTGGPGVTPDRQKGAFSHQDPPPLPTKRRHSTHAWRSSRAPQRSVRRCAAAALRAELVEEDEQPAALREREPCDPFR